MPCNSDYLEPTQKEKQIQRAAKLALFAMEGFKIKPPDYILACAKQIYASDERVVPFLCRWLSNMKKNSPNAFERLVYNAKNKKSRDLADWWDEHLAADKKRIQREKEIREDKVRQGYIDRLRTMPLSKVKKLFGD